MSRSEVLDHALNGDRDKFSVKEIMIEHIREQRIFEDNILEKFNNGSTKISVNREKIQYQRIAIASIVAYLAFISKYLFFS